MGDCRLIVVAVYLVATAALSSPSWAQQDNSGAAAGSHVGQSALDGELAEAAEPIPDDAVPVRRSFLAWFLGSLGWRYTLLLPAATFLSFLLLCLLIIYGRGWAAGAAAVLLVPLPLLVGLMGAIDGLIGSYLSVASSDVAPGPQVIAEGISTGLVSSLAGICLMVPNYWLAVIGLLVRSMRKESEKP